MYSVGKSNDGSLGHGKKVDQRSTPTRISCPVSNFQKVSCSVSEHHTHAAAITQDGTLYTFGSGYKGKLGHGNTEDCLKPTVVQTIPEKVIEVSCGGIHTAVISASHQLYTFGCGSDGR